MNKLRAKKQKGAAETLIFVLGALAVLGILSLNNLFEGSSFDYNKKIAPDEILIPQNLSTVKIDDVEIKSLPKQKIDISSRISSVSKSGKSIPVKAYVTVTKDGALLKTEELDVVIENIFHKTLSLDEKGNYAVFLSAEDANGSLAFEVPSKNELKENFLTKICGDTLTAENKDLDILRCDFGYDENAYSFKLTTKGGIAQSGKDGPNFYSMLITNQKEDANPEKASFFFYCPMRKIRNKADAFHVYRDLKNSLWKHPINPKKASISYQVSENALSFTIPKSFIPQKDSFKLFFLTASIIDTRQFRRLPTDFTPFVSIYLRSHTVEMP